VAFAEIEIKVGLAEIKCTIVEYYIQTESVVSDPDPAMSEAGIQLGARGTGQQTDTAGI
jgi:hypothetical protein